MRSPLHPKTSSPLKVRLEAKNSFKQFLLVPWGGLIIIMNVVGMLSVSAIYNHVLFVYCHVNSLHTSSASVSFLECAVC